MKSKEFKQYKTVYSHTKLRKYMQDVYHVTFQTAPFQTINWTENERSAVEISFKPNYNIS
jgi:hypothetical protein